MECAQNTQLLVPKSMESENDDDGTKEPECNGTNEVCESIQSPLKFPQCLNVHSSCCLTVGTVSDGISDDNERTTKNTLPAVTPHPDEVVDECCALPFTQDTQCHVKMLVVSGYFAVRAPYCVFHGQQTAKRRSVSIGYLCTISTIDSIGPIIESHQKIHCHESSC